jgi:ketosteroid isomerase-like protein
LLRREILEGAFERSDIIDIDYDIEEILILGDWAWEWHNQWSTQRLKATDEVRTLYIRAAQLFQRQHDGEWKVARYIGNAIPLDGDIEEHKKMIRTAKS